MDGHQFDFILLLRRIGIGKQRHVRQVMREVGLLAAGCFIFIDGLLELRQVVEPFLAALRAQHLFVAAVVEDRRQQIRDLATRRMHGVAVDQIDKGSGLRSFEERIVQVRPHRLVERNACLLRLLLQKGHAALAQVALRAVGDAQERKIIPVGDHPEVTERILDLGPVEELHAAVDRVGDLLAEERFLDGARHIVRPVQDRDIRPPHTFFLQRLDLLRDPVRLCFGIHSVMTDDLRSRGKRWNEFLLDARFVLRDQRVRRRQDLRRGAVVLHHHDGLRAGVMQLKIQQELAVRAAP